MGRLFFSPLGIGNGYVPERKEWIGAAISAVGGLASSLIGGGAAASAARAAERRQRASEAKEDAWYNRRYYEDYVDAAVGQNLVRRAKDFARDQWKKASGALAVEGGTDASVQMAKDAGNKMVGDTIANIAAADIQRKAQVDNIHMQNEQRFAQMDMNRELQRAQSITDAAQAASNAMMSIGSAVDQASAPNKPMLAGGSNSGTVKSTSSSSGSTRSTGGSSNVSTGTSGGSSSYSTQKDNYHRAEK